MISGVLLDRETGRPIVDRDVRAALEARGWEHVVASLERGRRAIFAAEQVPPLFMDVSNAYSGDELGLPYRDIMGEGVVLSTDLAVTAAGGSNSVNVAKGRAWVRGDTNADLQPTYRVYNDATVNLGISPDPANPRRVHIVGQVTDQGFAGTGRTWALQALHGTPAASPVLPALPASAVSLANVLVPAAAASSAAYTITDTRARSQIGGGDAPLASAGAVELIATQTLGADGFAAFGSIPQTYKHLWIVGQGQRSGTGFNYVNMRVNGLTTTIYDGQTQSSQAGTTSAAEVAAESACRVGYWPGVGSYANGQGLLEILLPDYTDSARWQTYQASGSWDWGGGTVGAAGRGSMEIWGLIRANAAITAIEIAADGFAATALEAGTTFSLYGIKG